MKLKSNTFAVKFRILTVMVCIALLSGMTTSVGAKGKPGPGADPAWVKFTYTGAIEGGVSCEEKFNADSTVLGCNHTGGFTLGASIFDTVGTDCFQDIVDAGGYTPGTIQVFVNNDGSADAWFRFHSPDRQGTDVLYVVETHDPAGWDPDFPPTVASPAVMASYDWTLRAANRRQEKYACLGGGEEFIGVKVERLP